MNFLDITAFATNDTSTYQSPGAVLLDIRQQQYNVINDNFSYFLNVNLVKFYFSKVNPVCSRLVIFNQEFTSLIYDILLTQRYLGPGPDLTLFT